MTYDDIKKRIRSITKVHGDNRRCFVCGSQNKIENHHLLRVADLSRMCVENHYFDINSLYIPLVDLCTLHHKKWHVLAEDMQDRIEITETEYDRYQDLMNRIIPVSPKIPERLVDDYIDLYTHVTDTIDTNLERCRNRSLIREDEIKQIFDNDVSWFEDKDLSNIKAMEELYTKEEYNGFDIA